MNWVGLNEREITTLEMLFSEAISNQSKEVVYYHPHSRKFYTLQVRVVRAILNMWEFKNGYTSSMLQRQLNECMKET